jgi:hypothetical protein
MMLFMLFLSFSFTFELFNSPMNNVNMCALVIPSAGDLCFAFALIGCQRQNSHLVVAGLDQMKILGTC